MVHALNSITKPYFRADIEGLRAVAVLLVVAYHAGLPGISGGYIGVDVFFVLSGYLITWLIAYEATSTGTINLVNFYARRARRLLPALAAVLLVTIPLGAIVYAPFEQRPLANTAVATASYLSNVHFARAAMNYLGADTDLNPLLHTWSLSVEEQFYLVWPLLVMWSLGLLGWSKRGLSTTRLLWYMAITTVISLGWSIYLTHTRQPWAFFLSPARA